MHTFLLESDNKELIFHCVMCNPPFFANQADQLGTTTTSAVTSTNNTSSTTDRQRHDPWGANMAAPAETQTPGGDIYFALRMIRESMRWKHLVGVFTVMLGKKSSLVQAKRILKLVLYIICIVILIRATYFLIGKFIFLRKKVSLVIFLICPIEIF